MAYETIRYETRDLVGVITLNRSQALNAVTAQMIDELMDALARAETTESVRALILTGAGRAFCAGQDVRVLAEGSREELATLVTEKYPPLIAKFQRLEKPIVAAINGVAVGSGCNLALACDIRIAADNASLGAVFVRIGAGPDSGCVYFLPRLVGWAKAAELIFTGAIVDAKEAERIGLVNKVVPPEQLMAEALALASKLAKGPTRAIAAAKRLLQETAGLGLHQALAMEAQAQTEILQTRDFEQGVRAFLEKREPDFSGR